MFNRIESNENDLSSSPGVLFKSLLSTSCKSRFHYVLCGAFSCKLITMVAYDYNDCQRLWEFPRLCAGRLCADIILLDPPRKINKGTLLSYGSWRIYENRLLSADIMTCNTHAKITLQLPLQFSDHLMQVSRIIIVCYFPYNLTFQWVIWRNWKRNFLSL